MSTTKWQFEPAAETGFLSAQLQELLTERQRGVEDVIALMVWNAASFQWHEWVPVEAHDAWAAMLNERTYESAVECGKVLDGTYMPGIATIAAGKAVSRLEFTMSMLLCDDIQAFLSDGDHNFKVAAGHRCWRLVANTVGANHIR